MGLEWWQTGVVYQIYPRSFQDTDGDGIGDLAGILERADYLSGTLGVDAVWVSPFYPSPMDDFGYDVTDYCDVDPLFGDLATFDRLLAGLHERGLRVILDLVVNHTSDRHPWFAASRSSPDDPKRDWYIWRDPAPDGGPPNNWLAVFGGPAWEWDEATGQYYLHSFLPSQPDLDWRNPEVEEAMFDVVHFWLDRGVDGFRLDVAEFVMKHPDFPDNPPAARGPSDGGAMGANRDMGAYSSLEHRYDKDHPDVHPLYRRMRRLLDSYEPARIAIGEIHLDLEEWLAYYGEDLDEFHLPFNFRLVYTEPTAEEIGPLVDRIEDALPPGAWPNWVLGNHDESRLATRFGPDHTRLAAVLLLTLRGTPTLYYGDELGLSEAEIAPEDQVDPWGIRVPGQGRDGCRTPMPWEPGPGGGFTTGKPWLPLGPAADARSVAAQQGDPHSILNLYRALLDLRRREPSLHAGAYRRLEAPDGVLAYRREAPGAAGCTVVLNFGEKPEQVGAAGTIAVSTDRRDEGTVVREAVVAPGQAVVLVDAV